MKTDYVWPILISLHANFHNDRTMRTVTLLEKSCRWGEGEGKEPRRVK